MNGLERAYRHEVAQWRQLAYTLSAIVAVTFWVGFYSAACAKAPPNLTPPAVAAFYGTQLIHDLDHVRDIAVAAHQTSPPLLSADETLKIVQWHSAAINAVHAAPDGWKATIAASLTQVVKQLSPAAQQTVAPYVLVVQTLLQEIP